jgi:hypothetical protein
MQFLLANPLLGGDVQGARHVVELLAAFGRGVLREDCASAVSATGSSPNSTRTPTTSTTARSG